MRICYLTPTYFPVTGGAESHLATLAQGVARSGHEVLVVTDRPPGASERERIDGVDVIRVPTTLTELPPDRVMWEERVFGLLGDLQSVLGHEPVDLIHAHCQVSMVVAAMAALELGCGLVGSMHETVPETDSFGRGRSAVVFGHLPYDAVIVGSDAFERQALAYGARPDRVRRIGYGIDLELWQPVDEDRRRARRRDLALAEDDRAILLVGRFKARKGQLALIEAMPAVLRADPKAVAVLMGGLNCASLQYLDEVRDAAAGFGDRVRIVESTLPFDAMPEIYSAADVVVQPSTQEGFGLAVAEAMACARPIVVTSTAGLDEVTSDDTAVRVPPGDVPALATALIELLEDPDRARARARRAQQAVAEQCAATRMITDHLRVYEDVISGRRGSAAAR